MRGLARRTTIFACCAVSISVAVAVAMAVRAGRTEFGANFDPRTADARASLARAASNGLAIANALSIYLAQSAELPPGLPTLTEGVDVDPPPMFSSSGEWVAGPGGDPHERWSYAKTGPASCSLRRPLAGTSTLVGTLDAGRWIWFYDPGNGDPAFSLGELPQRH